MRLQTGKDTYEMPPYDRVYGVTIKVSGTVYSVTHMAIAVVFACKKVRGVPTRFCTMGNKIIFNPVPDKAYTVRVRYTPAMMEL